MSKRLPRAGLRAAACAALMSAVLVCSPALARQADDPARQPPPAAAPPPIPWYQTISFNGLVSTSYVTNFNAPASRTNQFRVFDSSDRTIALDVVELVVQRTVSEPGDAGFRADFTFGTSVPRVTAALGLFRDASGHAGDFDLQQAFLSYVAPRRPRRCASTRGSSSPTSGTRSSRDTMASTTIIRAACCSGTRSRSPTRGSASATPSATGSRRSCWSSTAGTTPGTTTAGSRSARSWR